MYLLIKELYELKARFILMLLLLGIFGYSIIAYYDYFLALIDINTIKDSLDISYLHKFIDSGLLTEQIELLSQDIDFYVWSQWFGKNLYQLLILGIMLLGFSSFAREAEHNTMSFLLSNFTRRQIFTNKILAGLILLLLLVTAGCILPAILAPFNAYSFSWYVALAYTVQIASAALLLYAAVILFSVLSKDVVKPIIASIIFFVALSIPRYIEVLVSFDIYRYMTAYNIFAGNGIKYSAVAILVLLSLFLLSLSWQIFKNKNY